MCDLDLSDKNIRKAPIGSTLRDLTVRGLHFRKTASGGAFYLYYRTKAGIERRPKLEDHGIISLTEAREIARTMLGDVARGLDPAAIAKVRTIEPTVDDLWTEFWKRRASRKKSGLEDARSYRNHIQPRFGSRPLSYVTYSRLSDMMDDMSERPIAANRVLALTSTMFNFAVAPLGWCAANPAKAVRRNRERKRRRYMKGEEAARISEVLHAAGKENPQSVAFIYLLIMTGARTGEIAGAQWSWLEGNVLRLPDSKTGEKTIYLPQVAIDLIDRLPKTSGTITGIKRPKKLWERIRKEAGCPDLRLHDLRHSFASAALSAGLSLAQIGELLGHKSTQTTARYAHLVEEVGVAAATATADVIMSRLGRAPAL
jgi:integrase